MGLLSSLEGLGVKTMQFSSTIEQRRETDIKRRFREGMVVAALLSPVLLGLLITSLPRKRT
jgi:hypothetical protein